MACWDSRSGADMARLSTHVLDTASGRPAAGMAVRLFLPLAALSEAPCCTTRTFLSPAMREVHRLVSTWMEEAGLHTRVDAAGNLRGVCGDGPRLMIGSHLDTVPRAGAFDGILGVM